MNDLPIKREKIKFLFQLKFKENFKSHLKEKIREKIRDLTFLHGIRQITIPGFFFSARRGKEEEAFIVGKVESRTRVMSEKCGKLCLKNS